MKKGITSLTRSRGRIAAGAALAAGIALLAIPVAAQAITVSGTAAPGNLQAGANSDFTIQVNLGPAGEDVKDLIVGLPPVRSATRRPLPSAPSRS